MQEIYIEEPSVGVCHVWSYIHNIQYRVKWGECQQFCLHFMFDRSPITNIPDCSGSPSDFWEIGYF